MIRTMTRTAGALALMLALAATGAHAQRRGLVAVPDGDRGGFWFAIDAGAGREQFDALDGLGYSSGLTKPVLTVRAGGTVSQNLRVGVEVFSWFNSFTSDGTPFSERVGHAAAIAQLYPVRSAGLFVKGSAGLAFSSIREQGSFAPSVTDYGFSYGAGVGYEVKVGRNLFIAPTLDYVQQSNSSGPGLDYRERFLNAGVSILFQSGRRY